MVNDAGALVETAVSVDKSKEFVKGFAHCNLGNYSDAETAYTDGLALAPDCTMLYLLRAEVRQNQGKNGAAFSDIQAILSSSDSTAYADLIEDVKAGSLNCRTFWVN